MTVGRSSGWFSLLLLVAFGCSSGSKSTDASADVAEASTDALAPGAETGTDRSTPQDAESPDVSSDLSSDVSPDVSSDVSSDARADAEAPVVDASTERTADAGSDASDASTETTAEAGSDASDASTETTAPTVRDDVFYVHWCSGDCVFTAGADDPAHHVSSLISTTATLTDTTLNAAGRAQVLARLGALVAGLPITFVESRPAAGPYRELVFGGLPTQVGLPNGVAVQAPFVCGVEKENTIAFIFTNIGLTQTEVFDVAGFAIGKTYGIDDAYDARDVMSSLAFNGLRSFVNEDVSCGQTSTRTCCDGKAKENTHALLAAKAGH